MLKAYVYINMYIYLKKYYLFSTNLQIIINALTALHKLVSFVIFYNRHNFLYYGKLPAEMSVLHRIM